MPVFLLSLLGGVGSIGKAFLAWLSRRSLGEIVCLAFGVALLIDHGALLMAHRHSAKLERQLVKCGEQAKALTDQLHEISTKRDAQRVITQTRIVTVTKRIHDADEIAKKVEQAPPAANCKTNSAVMGADL